MDWNAVTMVAAVVAAVAALIGMVLSFAGWRLQNANHAENQQYKERLRLEEHYFKLHLLWQEIRVALITLQGLPLAVSDYVPHLEGLPIAQLSEALATKELLTPEGATRVRIARDDLLQLEQLASDGRKVESRRRLDFDHKFPEQLSKALASLEQAREALLEHLPG